jgi:two-component system, OmpR family, phosphate regulon sensor histidine kinase PhoR
MATSIRREDTARAAAFLRRRLLATRHILVAAGLLLLGFAAFGALSFVEALIGFAVLAGAALIGSEHVARKALTVPLAEPSPPRTAPLVDALIAGLPAPVIVLDRDSRVVAFNARAATLAPALRRGEPASLALRVPEVVDAIRRVASGAGPQRVEFSERVPVDRWYAAHVMPVEIAEGEAGPLTKLTLLSLDDLTPLRRVEEMRADFVANASHELRTPLASLSGFIETLQGPARDDPAARERFLGIMKSQAARMARLIDDLLSLSRVELNAHVQPQTTVDLVSIVRQVADALQMLARDRDVTISIASPPEPLMVRGDRDELTRVFENLVENALKYGASGRRVELTLARSPGPAGGDAIVTVRDYGPGIAAEHLPRLTERFYRIDVGQSRAEGGTGLGLALVKHILNRHLGRLTIESSLGAGAVFTVRLALVPTRR